MSAQFREEVAEVVRKYGRDKEVGYPAELIANQMCDVVIDLYFRKADFDEYYGVNSP